MWRDGAVYFGQDGDPLGIGGLLLVLAGAVLLAIGCFRSREEPPAWTPWAALALAIAAAPVLVLPWIGESTVLGVHTTARTVPAMTLLPFATAAVLFSMSSRRVRAAAAVCALVGLGPLLVGTRAFLDAMDADPLRASPDTSVQTVALDGEELGIVDLDFSPSSTIVSPAGGAVAFVVADDRAEVAIHAGRLGGPLARYPASAAAFIDDTRALLMRADEDGTVTGVRMIDLEGGEGWTTPIADIRGGTLALDDRAQRWTVFGIDAGRRIAAVRGGFDGRIVEQRQWTVDGESEAQGWPAAIAGGGLIMVRTMSVRSNPFDGFAWWRWMSWRGFLGRVTTALDIVEGGARRTLAMSSQDLSCTGVRGAAAPVVCVAYDGHETRVLALDADRLTWTALASVPGEIYFFPDEAPDSALTGWSENGPVAFDVVSHRFIRPAGNDDQSFQIAVSAHAGAVVSFGDTGYRVRVIRRH
jgi:hypothetical protein